MKDLLQMASNTNNNQNSSKKQLVPAKKWIKISGIFLAILLFSFLSFTGIRAWQFKNYRQTSKLSNQEALAFQKYLLNHYGERSGILKDLPYKLGQTNLDIWAKSYILIDTANGNILSQKNAD